jgi:hypothetical protein
MVSREADEECRRPTAVVCGRLLITVQQISGCLREIRSRPSARMILGDPGVVIDNGLVSGTGRCTGNQ